jgi:hypothetical protein
MRIIGALTRGAQLADRRFPPDAARRRRRCQCRGDLRASLPFRRSMRMRLLVLSFAAISIAGASGAAAQSGKPRSDTSQWDQKYDLKPLVPPVLPLPPNALVTPGSTIAPAASDRAPLATSPSSEPAAPGLKITIPTR